MKTMKFILTALVIAFLGACSTNSAQSFDSFEDALKDANASIDQAKAADYEWRDSRKLVDKAEKLNAEGKTEEAFKTIAKAKEQAVLALAQAKEQAGTVGPR